MAVISAYHDADSTAHQKHVDELSSHGFHMLSLCMYGDPSSPLFAAVWAQEPAASWIAVHGKNGSDYQDWVTNTAKAQGYSLRLVSALGAGSSARFAAVAEKTGALWAAKHDLAEPDLGPFLHEQYLEGLIPTALSAYGTPSSRLYAVVCQGCDPGVQWSRVGAALGPSGELVTAFDEGQWQNAFDAYARVPSRPGTLAVTSDQRYVAVYRNDSLGLTYVRHGMSSSDYQHAFDQMRAQGYFPVLVAAGGTGEATRFAAAFATQTAPTPRTWSATGPAVSYLSGIDATVESFMKTYGIRAGQVAVVRHGRLVYSRGFTFGEPEYPVTQPGSLIRIASCSKAFTIAAIDSLAKAHKLSLTDLVFPLLGITAKALGSQSPDPNIDKVTVRNLIDHRGGWNDGRAGDAYLKTSTGSYVHVASSAFDPVFASREIARALALAGPPSKRDVARYMYGEPLQFPPGGPLYTKHPDGKYYDDGTAYSNLGYMLLGLVVEAVSGQPYVDYLRQHVVADVYLSRTAFGSVWPNEVLGDEPDLGLTPFDFTSSLLTPAVYGGEDLVTELCDSGGGLMTNAQTLASFIHNHAVWPGLGEPLSGRTPGRARSGSEAGSSALAVSGTDDIDWAYIFNTRWSVDDRIVGKDARGNDQTALDKLGDDLTTVLGGTTWLS